VIPESASLADLYAVPEEEVSPADEAFIHVLVLVIGVDGPGTDVIIYLLNYRGLHWKMR